MIVEPTRFPVTMPGFEFGPEVFFLATKQNYSKDFSLDSVEYLPIFLTS